MNKLLKKVVLLVSIGIFIASFSLVANAEEGVEEVVLGDASAVVTLTLDEAYQFIIENGVLVGVEGSGTVSEALISSLNIEALTIEEGIVTLLSAYEVIESIQLQVYPENEVLLQVVMDAMTYAMLAEEPIDEADVETDEEVDEEGQPEFIIERFELAEELGITPGKTNLLQKLDALTDGEFDDEQWSEVSVKEIMMAIKESSLIPVQENENKGNKKPDSGKGKGKK